MSLDLDYDETQQAVADAARQLCRTRCDDAAVKAAEGTLPRDAWKALAELGVLGVATPDGDGGALEAAAALEELGYAAFPGPLADSLLAVQVLDAETAAAVAAGDAIVSLGAGGLLPWAPLADVFIELGDGELWRARPRGPIEPVSTLGGEPWGRVALEREAPLPGAGRGLALADVALAATLVGGGRRLVEAAAEHARTRVQFGRAIGEFQAVAHPVAEAHVGVEVAATLARAAAFAFDVDDPEAPARAAAARLSARRAGLDAVHTAHQVFGAVGVTLEGPIYHVSRRVRQLASHPLGLRAARRSALSLFEPAEVVREEAGA